SQCCFWSTYCWYVTLHYVCLGLASHSLCSIVVPSSRFHSIFPLDLCLLSGFGLLCCTASVPYCVLFVCSASHVLLPPLLLAILILTAQLNEGTLIMMRICQLQNCQPIREVQVWCVLRLLITFAGQDNQSIVTVSASEAQRRWDNTKKEVSVVDFF